MPLDVTNYREVIISLKTLMIAIVGWKNFFISGVHYRDRVLAESMSLYEEQYVTIFYSTCCLAMKNS